MTHDDTTGDLRDETRTYTVPAVLLPKRQRRRHHRYTQDDLDPALVPDEPDDRREP